MKERLDSPKKIVFFTDALSVLQTLLASKDTELNQLTAYQNWHQQTPSLSNGFHLIVTSMVMNRLTVLLRLDQEKCKLIEPPVIERR